MGTRADFYVGRGKDAEWLGSIAWDGYPDGIDAQIKNCAGEAAFRHAVNDFLSKREDATLPKDGWPWPWDDSNMTDYAYAIDGEQVWGSCFGNKWFKANEAQPEDGGDGEKGQDFPNMKARKRVTLGARSGTLVFGVK